MGTHRRTRRKQSWLKRNGLMLFVVVLIVAVVIAVVLILTPKQKTESTELEPTVATQSQTHAEKPTNEQSKLYFEKFSKVPQSGVITAGQVSVGQNILVNNEYKYNLDQQTDFIEFNELPDRNYELMFDDLDGDRFTLYEFNLMTQTFAKDYPDEYLGVCSGYRTYDAQKRNFDASVEQNGEEETLKWFTRPGYSEHHTGYAIDFNTNSYGDRAFTGEGNQSWFKENCHKFGFIHRYTAEKQSITGINPEAWHFRQVGIPHADYIMKNNICYEEYVEQIKKYSSKNPLVIKPDAGGEYCVFYQQGKDGEQINLAGYTEYYCSGNNVDGFIITAIK